MGHASSRGSATEATDPSQPTEDQKKDAAASVASARKDFDQKVADSDDDAEQKKEEVAAVAHSLSDGDISDYLSDEADDNALDETSSAGEDDDDRRVSLSKSEGDRRYSSSQSQSAIDPHRRSSSPPAVSAPTPSTTKKKSIWEWIFDVFCFLLIAAGIATLTLIYIHYIAIPTFLGGTAAIIAGTVIGGIVWGIKYLVKNFLWDKIVAAWNKFKNESVKEFEPQIGEKFVSKKNLKSKLGKAVAKSNAALVTAAIRETRKESHRTPPRSYTTRRMPVSDQAEPMPIRLQRRKERYITNMTEAIVENRSGIIIPQVLTEKILSNVDLLIRCESRLFNIRTCLLKNQQEFRRDILKEIGSFNADERKIGEVEQLVPAYDIFMTHVYYRNDRLSNKIFAYLKLINQNFPHFPPDKSEAYLLEFSKFLDNLNPKLKALHSAILCKLYFLAQPTTSFQRFSNDKNSSYARRKDLRGKIKIYKKNASMPPEAETHFFDTLFEQFQGSLSRPSSSRSLLSQFGAPEIKAEPPSPTQGASGSSDILYVREAQKQRARNKNRTFKSRRSSSAKSGERDTSPQRKSSPSQPR